jgi:hypothetical protein
MDYAFTAARGDRYYTLTRRLFANRPDTRVVTKRGLVTVSDFFDHLSTDGGIQRPTGDLLVVSHGNDRAWMQIPLDHHQAADQGTDYEDVVKADAGASVRIPGAVNHDDAGVLTSMAANFRGCRIGAAGPFVDALKTAFGGQSPVTAPKHFHYVWPLGHGGMMEFLAYAFVAQSPTPLADRPAVVAALVVAGHTFRDGSPLREADVTAWVSRNVGPGHRVTTRQYVKLGRVVDGVRTLRLPVEFRHDVERYRLEITALAAPPAPADEVGQIRESLAADATHPGSSFADDHPLPIFRRFGHDTRDAFVDGLNWTCRWDARSKVLVCAGEQHVYTLLVPVTDPPDIAAGKLIYNFYPPHGSSDPVVDELSTGDDTMFYTA